MAARLPNPQVSLLQDKPGVLSGLSQYSMPKYRNLCQGGTDMA